LTFLIFSDKNIYCSLKQNPGIKEEKLTIASEIGQRLELITYISFVLEKYFSGGFISPTISDHYPDSVIRDVVTTIKKSWKIKKEIGARKYTFSR
jgi:hypothetical protein